MQYIVHRRFKNKAICGEVNLPAMTVCESDGELITHNGLPVCATASENAHQFFARDNDGKGMHRGTLTRAIQNTLAKHDKYHQDRWARVWENERCQQYKRTEYADYWLWNHDFFNAPIEDLQYIAALVGAKT